MANSTAQTVAALRRKADELNTLARMLEENASLLQGGAETAQPASPKRGPKKKVVRAEKKQGGRFAQLADFLKKNGPAKRTEIVEKSGIPEGTVSMLLAKPPFGKDENGLWKVTAQ